MRKVPLSKGRGAFLSLLSLFEGSKDRDSNRLFEMIVDFRYSGTIEITRDDKIVLDVIIQSLFPKVSVRKRRAFSNRLSLMESPSEILVTALIADEFKVAAPILARAKYLTDIQLTTLVAERHRKHNQLIANRKGLSQSVICALLEYADFDVFDILLDNENAVFGENAVSKLMTFSFGDARREERLVAAPHLTAPLVFHSYWNWLPASRWGLLNQFKLKAEEFGETLTILAAQEPDEESASVALMQSAAMQDRLSVVNRQGLAMVLDLSELNILVEFMMSGLALSASAIKRILTDTSGASLALLCCAIGLDAERFEQIYASLCQNEIDRSTYAENLHRATEVIGQTDSLQAAAIIACLTYGETINHQFDWASLAA